MNRLLVLFAAAVLALLHRDAVACPDYATALAQVDGLLSWDHDVVKAPGWGDSAALIEAYEALGEAGLCSRADATAGEIAAWAATLPTGGRSDGALPTMVLDDQRVLVIWRRGDMGDGGRAVIYKRNQQGWSRTWFGDLPFGGLRPGIIGRIGVRVMIEERLLGSNHFVSTLRTFRIDDDQLVEESALHDLFELEVFSTSRRKIRLRYELLANYRGNGPTFVRYEMTIQKARKQLLVKTTPRDVAQDFMHRYCGAATDDARRKLVKGRALADRLPTCEELSVADEVRVGKRYQLHISVGQLYCKIDEELGGWVQLEEATLTVAKVKGVYKITAFTAKDCPQVRAWRDTDPFW